MEKNLLLILCFICSCSLFSSCEEQKQKKVVSYSKYDPNCDSEIDSIKISYFNCDIEFYHGIIDCDFVEFEFDRRVKFSNYIPKYTENTVVNYLDRMNYFDLVDTLITECSSIKEIESELPTLSPDKEYNRADIRMVVRFYYKNGEQFRLGLGVFPKAYIMIENIKQKDNPKLIYLLRKHAGYYHYFGEESRKEFHELHDTTFHRDPIPKAYGD